MNKYAIIILIALIGDYLLSLLADRLNLKNQAPTPPSEFSDLVDEKNYRKIHCPVITGATYSSIDFISRRPNGASKSKIYNVNRNGHLVCRCNCLDVGKKHTKLRTKNISVVGSQF